MLDPVTRFPWLLVAVSALALEATALYFQYGMQMDPCVLCVYQRSAVLGIALGGLIGLIQPRWALLRLLAYAVIGVCAGLGLRFAWLHAGVLRGESFECTFLPEFPTWLPLHEWLPALFQPTGLCGEIDWSLFDFTMPEVMVGIFVTYLTALGYAVIRDLLTHRS